MKDIYAGCDVDDVVKLYRIKDGKAVPIRLQEWIGILKAHRAEMGEMLVVDLSRDEEDPIHGR